MEALEPGTLDTYLALRHRYELQDGTEGLMVQHTFLAVRTAPEVPRRPRATSAPPPPGACDHEVEALAALTNKPPPVTWSRAVASRAPGSGGCAVAGPKLPDRCLALGLWRSRPGDLDDTTPSESTAMSADTPGSVTSATSSQATFVGVPSPASSQEGKTEAAPSLSEALVDGSRELTDEDLLSWVPRTPSGTPTSIGSLEHADGTCKPCLFAYHATKACANGLACLFCHFEHPPKRRAKNIYRQKRG